MAGRSPKIGERAYARSPIFGYPLNFREVLIIILAPQQIQIRGGFAAQAGDLMPDGNKKPYLISIANEKGGVGKTTTALAIGTLLAQRGYKVLLFDLDPQGNLTLSLGYKPHEMPAPDLGLATSGTLFAKDSFSTETENLDLIFARALIVDDDYQMRVTTGESANLLSQDLMLLKRLPYDYVVIDCPPSMGKIALNSLLVSDLLIIPSQAEFFSAFALKEMMEMIGVVRREGNPDLPYRILITLFDKRNRIHHSIKNQLSHTFGSGIFETIIEVDTTLRKMAILGFSATNSRGEKQYRNLVDELLEYRRHAGQL
jgi:chromosome partitioning protein